jgi:Domain of unknown function (DUF1844)
MNEEQTSYKVTDRRLFNPDGTPRDVPENERPEVETPRAEVANVVAASDAEPPAAASVVAEATPQEPPAPAEPKPTSLDSSDEVEPNGVEDPAGFPNFILSIASNAASSLGMMEHPVTGKREVDLELGKHWIDVLGMLQQKTHGNLLPQEQQILEGLLADLRMQYVSLTNATPKARTFSSRDITGG